jgi:hypothetical protein
VGSNYYRSSYGAVRLWISKLTTDKSRTQVVHEMASGDDFVVQDRGQGCLRATGTVLFDYMRGDTLSPKDRLDEFKAIVQEAGPHVFTHPNEGSFDASIGRCTYDIDDSGNLIAEVEFIASGPVKDTIPAGASSIPASGAGLVDAAADALTAEFLEIGVDDEGVGRATKDAADGWVSATTVSPRDVLVQTGAFSTQLSAQSAQLEDDIEQWQAFKSTLLLADSVRVAAESATSDTASTFIVRLGAAVPLRSFLASEYGADEADLRYEQVMALNDIATPALIEAGSELQLPSQSPRSRNG